MPWEGDRKAQRRDIAVVHGVSTPEVERLEGCLGTVSVLIGSLILVKLLPGFRLTREVSIAIARHAARRRRADFFALQQVALAPAIG